MFGRKRNEDDLFAVNQEGKCLGKIGAVFGGVTTNLRDAKFKDGAHLRVFCMFGGADILVPEDVRIEMHAFCLFGGISDKRKQTETVELTKTLYIRGFCIFGGADIK